MKKPWLPALLVLWPGVARGQTTPPAARPIPSGDSWILSLWARETWDSNVRFTYPSRLEPLADSDDVVSQLNARLSHAWGGARGQFALSARGTLTRFLKHNDLNRFGYGAAAAGQQRLSPRLAGRAEASYELDFNHDIAGLEAESLLLPLARTRVIRASSGLSRVFSSRTSGAFDLRYLRMDFSSPGLSDGWRLVAAPSLSRRLGATQQLTLHYNYRRSSLRRGTGGRPSVIHSATGGWSKTLSPRFSATASLGLSYFPPSVLEGGENVFKPLWSAGLAARFERSALTARYSREAGEFFGYGRLRVADSLRLSYDRTLTPRLKTALYYDATRNNDPRDPEFHLWTHALGAGLNGSLGRRFSFFAGYAYRRRTQFEPLPVASHRVSLSVSFDQPW